MMTPPGCPMKARPVFVVLSIPLLIVIIFVSPRAFQNRHLVYPTPETESVLLKNYSPRSVLEPFESKQFNSQWLGHESDAAGEGFASHDRAFWGTIAIRPENWMALMTTLNNDASTQLLREGAQILNQTGDPRDGFHLSYKFGKSYGEVTISLLKIAMSPRVPPGCVQAGVNIALTEKWFPKEPGMITARIGIQPSR